MKKRTLKGWAFNKRVHGSSGIYCIPFFRREEDAIDLANRFTERRVRVVAATLTLAPPKPKTRRQRR